MKRLLVLQQLFNFSDEQMEFQLLDRMSFQRFAGLKNAARVPDRNTIWNFRERLVQAKVEHLIFDEVQRQLQLNGFNARGGRSLMPASSVRQPSTIQQKNRKSCFGYKLSVSVDHLVDVLDRGNSSRDFWADRGYHDKPCERWLKLNGWRPHIQRKGQAGKPIGERDKARNKRIASPRARVEHVFASLAQMGGKTIRSIGLARAQFGLTIKSAVYNLKRISSLLEMA